jgi:hypothetical protein
MGGICFLKDPETQLLLIQHKVYTSQEKSVLKTQGMLIHPKKQFYFPDKKERAGGEPKRPPKSACTCLQLKGGRVSTTGLSKRDISRKV